LKFLPIAFSTLLGLACQDSSWVDNHFALEMPEQGKPPSHFSQIEKSLEPESCGTCHTKQYDKWKSSLHSQTLQDPILWELPNLTEEERNTCYRCHSPLRETRTLTDVSLGLKTRINPEWEEYIKTNTHENGIFCASCHVRSHIRHGPPPQTSQKEPNEILNPPHNGYVIRKEYEKSEFCASCHESPSSGKKLNGKRLMETFSEWKASRFSKQGIECQSCHMPNREHDWKGIHDKDYVRNSLEINWRKMANQSGHYEFSILSKNIGHRFPSYAVPLVQVQFIWEFEKEALILREEFLGRIVDIYLEKEIQDNRWYPDETKSWIIDPKDWNLTNGKLKSRVVIFPDSLYSEKFRHNIENAKNLGIQGKRLDSLQKAYLSKSKSGYILYESSLPLDFR